MTNFCFSSSEKLCTVEDCPPTSRWNSLALREHLDGVLSRLSLHVEGWFISITFWLTVNKYSTWCVSDFSHSTPCVVQTANVLQNFREKLCRRHLSLTWESLPWYILRQLFDRHILKFVVCVTCCRCRWSRNASLLSFWRHSQRCFTYGIYRRRWRKIDWRTLWMLVSRSHSEISFGRCSGE
jgi:hypothetical protein